MNFITFSLGAAFFFAVTFLFRKFAGQSLPISTAYFIETSTQMLIMTCVILFVIFQSHKGIDLRSKGILFAVLAGISVVIGVGANYLALKSGFLSRVIGITSPSQIIFGVLFGLIITSDTFNFQEILGIAISIVGMLLIIFK